MMLVGRCKNIVTSQCGCTKSKVVKRKFEDQEDTERARRRRRRVRGASGALNAAQTLCLNSASLRRGVWRLTRLVLKFLARAGPAPAMDAPARAAAAAAEDDD